MQEKGLSSCVYYQTTWWEYNHLMETYFARLSACVTTGEVVRHVLILHPITSLWTMCKSSPKEDLDHIEMNMGDAGQPHYGSEPLW